jgi:hypothetical protein
VDIDIVDLGFVMPLRDALGEGDLIVNGGFWARYRGERRAQGLIMTRARTLAPLDEALGGGMLVVRRARAKLEPPVRDLLNADPDFAVQCRPRLVYAGERISGLNDAARSARTALCVRDARRTLDIYLTDPQSSSPTLRELAGFLREERCSEALNLDGGPSTAAAWREGGHVVSLGPGSELPYGIRFRIGGTMR